MKDFSNSKMCDKQHNRAGRFVAEKDHGKPDYFGDFVNNSICLKIKSTRLKFCYVFLESSPPNTWQRGCQMVAN